MKFDGKIQKPTPKLRTHGDILDCEILKSRKLHYSIECPAINIQRSAYIILETCLQSPFIPLRPPSSLIQGHSRVQKVEFIFSTPRFL